MTPDRLCYVDCRKKAPECKCRALYPYTHHGPAIHGDKLTDYLVSEANLREAHPELFEEDTQ